MTLSAWHRRLENHYGELAARRKALGLCVFALEHGLDAGERDSLSNEIRAHLETRPPERSHALAWIAYSAELGYRFRGDEFWQTFVADAPGWIRHGDRAWLRQQYEAFSTTYSGARPSGAWAEHFSNIAWPITHAILPQDLQFHLARALYHARFSLHRGMLADPSALGRQVAAESWRSSGRFQHFAAQHTLVGQIAAALLVDTSTPTEELIAGSALERIASDLERTQTSRLWMHSARSDAKRIRFLGTLPEQAGHHEQEGREASERRSVQASMDRAQLVLRSLDGTDHAWALYLRLPDVSPLARRFPKLHSLIATHRCHVAGFAGTPRPRGWLMNGAQEVRLSQIPAPDAALVRFEGAGSDGQHWLLGENFTLREGPLHVFRVRHDGRATEVATGSIRPGNSYVIGVTEGALSAISAIERCQIDCDGIRGYVLRTPDRIGSALEAELKMLGLRQARTARLRPVGLPPAVWDQDGSAEWLTTDKPRLSIEADFVVQRAHVRLEGAVTDDLHLRPTRARTILELPSLPAGAYTLVVTLQGSDRTSSGRLAFRVREPRQWQPGFSHQNAIFAAVDPPDASLEALWEGRVSLTVVGPGAVELSCTVELIGPESDGPLHRKELPTAELPIDEQTWEYWFLNGYREDEAVRALFDEAKAVRIQLHAPELGESEFLFEREFVPLRWAMKMANRRRTAVRLVDDSATRRIAATRYSFQAPSEPILLPLAAVEDWVEVDPDGGLYVARREGGRELSGVIVPPRSGSLSLPFSPRTRPPGPTPGELSLFLRVIEDWGLARLPGDTVAIAARRAVLQALIKSLMCVVGGLAWVDAERIALDPAPCDTFERIRRQQALIRQVEGRSSADSGVLSAGVIAFGGALDELTANAANESIPARIEGLAGFIEAFLCLPEATSPDWMAEFALRVSSCPEQVRSWAEDRTELGFRVLLALPELLRAARYIVMHVARSAEPLEMGARGAFYAGWTWR